jgi:hypothetical protein
MALFSTRRRRVAAIGSVACLILLGGWFGKDTSFGRWATTRTFVVAYALYDPQAEPNGVAFGPAGQAVLPPPSQQAIEQRLARCFPDKMVAVEIEGGPRMSQDLVHFRHEDLHAPGVEHFADAAKDILEGGDLFQLANRLRSLTTHDEAGASLHRPDPLRYLEQARKHTPLTCAPFAVIYGALCIARGYTSRVLGLSTDGTAFDHAVCEVYAPEFHKWILVDPDFNIAYRRGGEWLNALELQEVWQSLKAQEAPGSSLSTIHEQLRKKKDGIPNATSVELVILGTAGAPLRATNLFQSSCTGMNLEFFEYIAYPVRNDYLSHDYPFGHPARWKQYVLRTAPTGPWPAVCPDAYEPQGSDTLYWPVGRSWLIPDEAATTGDASTWNLFTATPNFTHFEVRRDKGDWNRVDGHTLSWPLKTGANDLEVRSVNLGGLRGETTHVTVTLAAQTPQGASHTGAMLPGTTGTAR